MPLTVVQVLPALEAGGVERGTVEVARELVRRGHRALVVSGGGRMVAELRACGAEHVHWPIGRKSPWTLRYLRPLRRLLESEGADILHARSRLPAWVAYLAWRGMPRDRRPRFVTTVHGPYTVNAYSAVMTRGERVIAISRWVAGYLRAHYPRLEPARIVVIPRGVDPSRYPHGFKPEPGWLERWRGALPQLAGRYLVTQAARITRWKGQEDFLEVIARLKRSGVPAHGLIAGAAERRRLGFLRELEAKVRACGLEQDITFLGHRPDLREVMAVSGAVVSLTREPEAFGRSTLEALALGVPVVGYAHGGTEEVLSTVFPQGLVRAGDVAAAAARLASFWLKPPTVPPVHPFTLSSMLDATLALYEELASGAAP